MKAVVLKKFGGLENLSPDDLPIPRVGRGSVLLRAAAASANPVDISIRKGASFSPSLPAIIGSDVAGVVEAVGEGVTEFAPRDEVFGCVGGVGGSGGTFAQYVLADVKLLAPKPRTLSMREAAALPLVAITAHEGITRGGVSPAHIHAAAIVESDTAQSCARSPRWSTRANFNRSSTKLASVSRPSWMPTDILNPVKPRARSSST